MKKKKKKDKRRFHGTFTLSTGQGCFGELLIKGRRTRLSLSSSDELPMLRSAGTVLGQTLDGTYITCVDCVGSSQGGSMSGTYRYAHMFPHYVLMGENHINPVAPIIRKISFAVDDLSTIFYDFDAFGTMHDASGLIEKVLGQVEKGRVVEVGEWAHIGYFTGKLKVAEVETVIGKVEVSHRPSFGMGGPEGVHIENAMYVIIEFIEPLIFENAIDRVISVARFLSVVAGRVQGIENIEIQTDEDMRGERHKPTRVHWSLGPKSANRTSPSHKPSPGDVPFHPLERIEELGRVLANWIKDEPTRYIARNRYIACLKRSNKYGPDRIVAAANMFDVMPLDATPGKAALPADLLNAQRAIIEILKAIDRSDEQNAAMAAIKRLGYPVLRRKVLHRAAFITDQMGSSFPRLDEVLKLAIKCRNYFVHGNSSGFKFETVEPYVPFLTDSLEFTFAASELIEAGWDGVEWNKQPHGLGHSFARFRASYKEGLAHLEKAGVLGAAK
ncbi:hypothetical protein J7373_14275 [Xanthomonas sp. A2111]|uniref:ApeA N-terminal domain-containing protein n=1 Tax=Xanthomonas hawaiiensis TaxID=3003247 RepID=A0ABU2I7U3_9XANT|nr:HEPN domain-containing protein [Xanthomonas sp. A2111]MBO9829416.1 hypothetical protein [Xanthomonas sp. A2111]MDS9993822.1 hypothetical protein [Xanthomonas sp. A2111]